MINSFRKTVQVFLCSILLVLVVFSSCEYIGEEDEEEFVSYTIEAGNHFANEKTPELFSTTHLRFAVTFDSTAIYSTVKSDNQGDVNKLYGFSDCGNVDQHINSARFGWRYFDQNLQLFAYSYTEGERSEIFLKNIQVNSEYICNIELIDTSYVFSIDGDDNSVEVPRGCSSAKPELSKLYPFFGGDEPAPHTITINIKEFDMSDQPAKTEEDSIDENEDVVEDENIESDTTQLSN